MSHIGMEINDELRAKLRVYLATINKSVREYLTELIIKDLEAQENVAKEK